MKLAQQLEANRLIRRQFSFTEDFLWYISPHMWTSTNNGGTVAAAGHGGILTLTPTGSANDYSYVASTNSIELLAVNTTLRIGALLNFTQANTNKAMVAFGLCNSVGAGTIIDTTGLPVASFTGAMFYTGSGNTVWSVRSSVGTTKTDTATTTTAGGGYQHLEIEFKVVSLTQVLVNYFIDGAKVLDPNASYPRALQHTLDATSAAAAQVFIGTKNGDANAQALLCDFITLDGVRS